MESKLEETRKEFRSEIADIQGLIYSIHEAVYAEDTGEAGKGLLALSEQLGHLRLTGHCLLELLDKLSHEQA